MRQEELMIGDYVQVNGEACKVISISYFDIGISDSKEDFYNEHIDNIKPIPLTPEILDKNGFEYYDNPVKVLMTNTINGHYVEIRLDRKEMAIWYDYDENNDGVYSDCLFPLPYWLHDFQHALRLCGIDKEIEL